MTSNSKIPLLNDSGFSRKRYKKTTEDSVGGTEVSVAFSTDKRTDLESYEASVSKQFHRQISCDTEYALGKANLYQKFECNATFMFIMFSLLIGIILIVFGIMMNMNDEMLEIEINTSYMALIVSLGAAFIFGSLWSILQYYPINMQCIQQSSGLNVFCIILGILLLALSVIAALDEFDVNMNNFDHIQYPFWLTICLFVISIICFFYVCCVNTRSARIEKEKREYLEDYYYAKMQKEEGDNDDYKVNEDKLPSYIKKSKHGALHPYDRSTCAKIVHTLTHLHLFSIIHLGSKQTLQSYDVQVPPKGDDIEYNFNKWSKLHKKQVDEGKSDKINTWKILWSIEGPQFVILCLISTLASIPALLQPTIIGELANFYEDETVDLSYGISLSMALLGVGSIRIFANAILMTMASRVVGRVISLLSYVIYYKSVNTSITSDGGPELSMGQKVTLLAADTRMVAYCLGFQPLFVAQYISMVAVIVLLHFEIGIAALPGWLFVVFISFPIQSVLGAKMMAAWKGYIAESDKRVKFIDELIKGIKVTKMYSWERALMTQILNYRQAEMAKLLERVKFNSILAMMNGATPALMGLIMFGTYIALGNTLDVQTVFVVITLIQMLSWAIRILPIAIMIGVGGIVAIGRLNTFYNAKDQVDMILMPETAKERDEDDYESKYIVYMKNASFKWSKAAPKDEGKKDGKEVDESNATQETNAGYLSHSLHSNITNGYLDDASMNMVEGMSLPEEKEQSKEKDYEFLLDRITMKLERGKLYGLVGSVGSGKSSLIQAILREMRQIDGVLKVNGSSGNCEDPIGYVSQSAFIMNQTVRANILWGLEYDSSRYKKCLKASSLEHDLSILANGDMTEIGERGINLSGGQKQRISFCRALYRSNQTDLFLMDDPLSAVDSHVGNDMFHKGIKGLLNGKTTLLVMNSHLHLLEYMDEVIILDKGKLVVQTSYKEVMENEEYAHLLPDDKKENEQEKEEENDETKTENEEKSEAGMITSLKSLKRTSSAASSHASGYGAIEQADREKKGKLTTKEDRKSGMVAWRTYTKYFNNAVNTFDHNEVVNDEVPHKSQLGGILWLTLEVLLLFLSQCFISGSDVWLALWGEEDEVGRFDNMADEWWLIIWSILIGCLILTTFFASYLFGWLANKAAQSLHMKTLYCVLRSPMSYFDQTPTGQILNRFSKDTNEMDLELPNNFVGWSLNTLLVAGYIVVIAISMPYALALLIFLVPMLYYLQRYFRMSSSDFKRLTQVTVTPIISQFSETLGGLDTIRAYKCAEDLILKSIRRKIRINHKIILAEQLSTRWFAQYMDLLIVLFLLALTLMCAYLRESFEAALLALAVVYGVSMMGMLQWAIRSSVDLEKNFTTVERLIYYETALEQNAKKHRDEMGDNEEESLMMKSEAKEINFNYQRPNKSWPNIGKIVIKNLKMRYRKDLDLVLDGVSMEINGGEKVGIVGRTGAGKSSLLLALFRLVEPTQDSVIEIDGIDCLKLGLKDLRSSLSIIPQEPVLFSGTLRFNLDPFGQRSDDEIWDVLKKCELFEFVQSKEEKLNFMVSEGGNNFSSGQKQLVCIGRALLKKSKILALDEATSSIDKHTDGLIQTLIRKEFSDVTVLCIAHRLDTIIDYDKVIVLSKGKVLEYDTPQNLMQNEESEFYKMVKSSHSSENEPQFAFSPRTE